MSLTIEDAEEPFRVLLADDHTLFREGLRGLLDMEEDLDVVGEAATGPQVLALTAALQPDVVILDLEMPGHQGVRSVRALLHCSPQSKIIVLSMHDESEDVRELIAAGAHAYLVKSSSRRELLAAIRGVVSDGARVVLSVSRDSLGRPPEPDPCPLSTREREVLTLVAEALTNQQIASRLHITEGTVKRHLRNIYTKLDAVTRLDAVNKAVDAAYISPRRGNGNGGVQGPM
jgi:DNA-binding NarL/FixJ family response regulator